VGGDLKGWLKEEQGRIRSGEWIFSLFAFSAGGVLKGLCSEGKRRVCPMGGVVRGLNRANATCKKLRRGAYSSVRTKDRPGGRRMQEDFKGGPRPVFLRPTHRDTTCGALTRPEAVPLV